jgi:dolichol-phosphate mannosyltransferase
MSEIGISVVVPVLDEADVIAQSLQRLAAVLEGVGEPWEVVVVDDGSEDGTAELVRAFGREHGGVRLLQLSRNFGHQSAVSAGLEEALGAWVAVIDGDLQDPPELIPEMLARAREGFDVVYGVRRRRRAALSKRFAYWLYYRVLRLSSQRPPPLDAGDFCIMSRAVVDQVNALPERGRYLRGLRHWVGFRQAGFPYDRPERAAGTTKYGLRKLVSLAGAGFLSSTRIPLRLATLFGFVLATGGFAWAVKVLVWKLAYDSAPDGFTALMVAMLTLGGTQLVAIGIVGQYIGRVLDQVEARPNYVVARRWSADDEGTADA